MKTFRKVIGVPDQNLNEVTLVGEDMYVQTGGSIETEPPEQPRGNSIRQHALDRQRKLLTVILQLAKNNSYTDELKIQLKNGDQLEANQFINLLNYALSPGKALAGVNEFVEVLHLAKVTPEMLINENVKLLLRNVYAKSGRPLSLDSSTQTDTKPLGTIPTQTEPLNHRNASSQTQRHARVTSTQTGPSTLKDSSAQTQPKLMSDSSTGIEPLTDEEDISVSLPPSPVERAPTETPAQTTATQIVKPKPVPYKPINRPHRPQPLKAQRGKWSNESGLGPAYKSDPRDDFDKDIDSDDDAQEPVKRKSNTIVEPTERPTRNKREPDWYQAGQGWETFDSDDDNDD